MFPTKAPKRPAEIDIPQIRLADYEPFAEAERQLTALKTRKADVDRRIAEAHEDHEAPHESATAAAARALLDGADMSAPVELDRRPRAVEALYAEQGVIQIGISTMTGRLDALRAEASEALLAEHNVRERYQDVLRRVYSAAVALGEACDLELRFRNALLDGQLYFTGEIPPNNWRHLPGLASDYDSAISLWVRNAKQNGYAIE